MESEMNKILAAATKGDTTARQRAHVLAYETYPSLGCDGSNRERFFHQVEVLLNAYRGP
jgi:hypothetical protein